MFTFVEKMHIINNSTEPLFSVASLDYGLEVNTEKSKYVFTSREHQAERHYNKKVVFKSIANCRYFGLILANKVDRNGTVVKVLCYKSEGRWFDPRWCH